MSPTPTRARTGESDLRREVAELLRLGPRAGVAQFVKENRADEARDCSRLEAIVRAVCAQNSTWIAEFKKRATRRAKCSARLAQLIRGCLETHVKPEPGTRLTADDMLRRYRQPRSTASLQISTDKALGFGVDSDYILALLHTLEKQQEMPIDLTVHFDCEHVYVHGLAILAAWCERHAAKVHLIASSDRVNRYLDVTGLRKVLQEQLSISAPEWDGEHFVALTRIQREDKPAADDAVRRLTELFRKHMNLTKDQTGALTTMLAELIENVYGHAESRYASYVMAQAYPKPRTLHVVIADTGIGIWNSFRRSESAQVRERAITESAALAMAVEKFVTSKTSKQSGFGLFVVRRLAELNGGQMRITSGRTTWETPAQRKLSPSRRSELTPFTPHLPWNGTEVSLIIRLDAPLPLLEVYKELGPPDRPEDFVE